MSDPKAQARVQIQAWKPVEYGGYARHSWEVDFDGDDLDVSTRTSGYSGYSDQVYIPLDVLRALLYAHGLTIVTAADVKVLEAMGALPDPLLTGLATWPHLADPIKAELARRRVKS